MLEVAVIVLIRLRMHDDGMIDARAVHAFQQMLRRGGGGRTVWRAWMVRNKVGAAPVVLDALKEMGFGLLSLSNNQADYVFVYHHDHYWAPDWQDTPEWKKQWRRACIDAGATAFISHGVPVIHGIEIYRDRPIFHGLGNFIFHTTACRSKGG